MKNLLSILLISMIFISSSFSEEYSSLTLDEYLKIKKSISLYIPFKEDSEIIIDAIFNLTVSGHSKKVELLSSKLNSKNLCFLLFITQKDILEKFEIEMDNFMQILRTRLHFKESPLMPKDIYNLQCIKKSNNRIDGSFSFNSLNSIKGKCLFKSKRIENKWIIEKLVVAKKLSENINDGLVIWENSKEK